MTISGRVLIAYCPKPDNIDVLSGLIHDESRSTITKMRILGDRQQMMASTLKRLRLLQLLEEQLISWLESLVKVITRHRHIRLWKRRMHTDIVATCIQVGEHSPSTDHRRS